VGWGIVPENGLSRSYRDMAGYLNRSVAERATEVYLVCAGIPLTLKQTRRPDVPASDRTIPLA